MTRFLLDLPNEVLLQIILNIPNEDLDSFASTCKALHSLASDALREHQARKAMYAHIKYGDPEENDRNSTWVHPTLMLRDLLRDNLLSYPRILSINDHAYEGPDWDDGREYSGIDGECDEDCQSEVYHALQAFPDDVGPLVKACPYVNGDCDLMRGILEKGDIGATLGLLINLLPNLTTLKVTDYNDGSHGVGNFKQILDEMLNSTVDPSNNNFVGSTYPTCKLREFSITRSDEGIHIGSWDVSMYAPLFYLPSMQSISLGYLRTSEEVWSYPGHHSRLERLYLKYPEIDLKSFENYTKDIKNLQELHLRLFSTISIPSRLRLPVGKAVQALLRSAGHSLRHLELRDANISHKDFRESLYHIGSLKGFQVLETAEVAAYMFIAPVQSRADQSNSVATASLSHPSKLINCFPPSVVRVKFTDTRICLRNHGEKDELEFAVDMLQELPEKKSELLPLLERVVFDYPVPSFRYRHLDLISQCREVGVIVANHWYEKE